MVNYNRVIGWSHGAPPTPAEIKKSSSSKRPAPAPMQTMSKAEYDKVFADYRAGTITQAQAVGQLKGSEAQASFQADLQRQQAEAQAKQQEIAKQQELARQQEAQRLAEQQRATAEQQRLQQLAGATTQPKVYFKEADVTRDKYGRITGFREEQWTPKDKDAVVVYTHQGETIGRTSVGGIQKGIKTDRAEYKLESGEIKKGSEIVKDIVSERYSQDIAKEEFFRQYEEDLASKRVDDGRLPLTIDVYQPASAEELKKSEMYEKLYGTSGVYSKVTGAIKEAFVDPITGLISWAGKKKTPQQEVAELITVPSETGVSATGITRQKIEKELSEDALIYKRYTGEEFTEQIKFEREAQKEKQKILDVVSVGGISESQAETANRLLSESLNIKATEYQKAREQRLIDIREEAFKERRPIEYKTAEWVKGVLPEWKFNRYETGEKLYDIGIPSGLIKGTMVGGSFASGLYSGVREQPLTIAKTFGIAVGVSVATAGLGAKASAIYGVEKVAKVTSVVAKGTKGLYGLYGFSIGARVLGAEDLYGGAKVLGRITSTELIPLFSGYQLGAYGVRRYQLSSQIKSYAKQLPEEVRMDFLKTLKEAKSLRGITPEVKPLDLSRLKALEGKPLVQKALVKYFQQQRGLIIGGSIAQQPQLEKGILTKRPGDIDVYVKTLLGGEVKQLKLGQQYARDISKLLRGEGLKAVAQKGKVLIGGEKFLEIHPYSTYLKPNIEQVIPFYRTARVGLTKTTEGINILKLDIQAPRKVIGYYLEPIMTGKVRLKDLPAYESIKESLLISAGKLKDYPQFMSFGVYDVKTSLSDLGLAKDLLSVKPVTFGGEVIPKKITSTGGIFTTYYKPYVDTSFPYISQIKKSYTPQKITKPMLIYTPIKTTTPITPYVPYTTLKTTTPITSYTPIKITSTVPYTPIKDLTPIKITPYVPKKFLTPSIPPYTPERITPFRTVKQPSLKLPSVGKRFKQPLRQVETFGVFVRRKGKFAPIGTELTLSQAMRLGEERVSTTLARTFKVRPTGKKRDIFAIDEIGEPDPSVFREFKVRRGERIPTPRQFIERSRYALSSPSEVAEIQRARKRKKLNLFGGLLD